MMKSPLELELEALSVGFDAVDMEAIEAQREAELEALGIDVSDSHTCFAAGEGELGRSDHSVMQEKSCTAG